MDARRWRNVTRSRDSYTTGDERTRGGPLELFLEASARCNLRCRMCAINFDSRYQPKNGRPPLFLPELFDRLRPTFPTLMRAHLYGLGEPVLNPHLTDYIRDLSDAGVEVWFTTNATLIDDEKADAFARAGADRISISIDGGSAETYERIRRGASFEALMRGLRALGKARERYGKPRLTVNFVGMKSNIHELPRLIELGAEVGIEEMNVEPLFYWGKTSAELDDHYGHEALNDFDPVDYRRIVEDAGALAGQAGIYFSTRFLTAEGSMDYRQRVSTAPADGDWLCSEPWATVYVTVAGEVRTCCLNDVSFGNLFEQTFAEVWNGDAFRRFRRQHRVASEIPSGCDSCVHNGRKRHSPLFDAVEPVSYAPLLKVAPEAPPRCEFHLIGPHDGEVVTDPLIVHGQLPASWWNNGDPSQHRWPRLYIDRTPVADLGTAVIGEGRFLMVVPVPYLTEGAHVLSLGFADQETSPPSPGWDRRTIHFWRPRESADHLVALRTAAAVLDLPHPVTCAAARINGHAWSAFSWIANSTSGPSPASSPPLCRGAALLDLGLLAPGVHRLEVEPQGGPVSTFRLEHFVC